MKKQKVMWAVMKAQDFSIIKLNSISILTIPLPEGPQRFVPLFNTKRQAEKWNHSKKDIAKVILGELE